MKRYPIKECFLSLQGEGMWAGRTSVFLRFAGCNLKCRKETHGFDCDTDFEGGRTLSVSEVVEEVVSVAGGCEWIVLTGGEPALFLDPELAAALGDHHNLAIETNGTVPLKARVDWVSVSPKRGERLALSFADEIKIVLAAGQPLHGAINGRIDANHYLLSPAFEGDTLPEENLRYCIDLCLRNPRWKLSVQQHKLWKVR